MKRLVAIVALPAAILSSVAAGPADEVTLTTQRCAALSVSAHGLSSASACRLIASLPCLSIRR